MRLTDIETRLKSMQELQQIIGALRALASMRMQEAQRALAAVREYAGTLGNAVSDALLLLPDSPARRPPRRPRQALVLCTSEHGFVGAFNERLLEAAERDLGSEDALFILGTRGGGIAAGRGRRSLATLPAATRLASVPETVRRVVTGLYRLIASGEVARARVIFARVEHGSTPRIESRPLFPLELSQPRGSESRPPPLHHLPPAVLLEKLTAEYVFALLTEAATESLASENAARFNAMEAAHDNVSKKLEELERQVRQARQEEITSELLDLVTGATA